jgi:hypothetical protein
VKKKKGGDIERGGVCCVSHGLGSNKQLERRKRESHEKVRLS